MANYAKNMPHEQGGAPMTGYPSPVESLAVYHNENAVASSALSLHPNTTQIEVGAVGGQGVVIRWVSATETAAVAPRASVVASGLGANFDHFIPAGTYRQFVVPRDANIGSGMNGQAGSVNGLIQRVARINAGPAASSMLLTEY